MSAQKVDLIRQALSAAESSIKLARQLLGDIEKDGFKSKPKARELPGTVGFFDGQSLVTEAGERFPVPENYASKSILVVGDTLKLVEDGGEKRFKQIEHVKRHKTIGILAKKDGKWAAVSSEGSYRVLPASVGHFEGDVGDEALLQLPAANLQVPWAAVESISKRGAKGTEETKAIKETDEKKETKVTQERKEMEPAKKEAKEKEEVKVEETKPARNASHSEAGGEPKEKKEVKVDVVTRDEDKKETKAADVKETKEPDKRKEAKQEEKAPTAATIESTEKKIEVMEKDTAPVAQIGTIMPKEAVLPTGAVAAEPQKTPEAPKEPEVPKEVPKVEAAAEDELA